MHFSYTKLQWGKSDSNVPESCKYSRMPFLCVGSCEEHSRRFTSVRSRGEYLCGAVGGR